LRIAGIRAAVRALSSRAPARPPLRAYPPRTPLEPEELEAAHTAAPSDLLARRRTPPPTTALEGGMAAPAPAAPAVIIDGKATADKIRDELRERVTALKARFGRVRLVWRGIGVEGVCPGTVAQLAGG
jgi:hypothetical protein